MAILGQLAFTGLAIGGVYALIALGIVLIYRATNVVNFAQGEFCMLGAYALVFISQGARVDYFLAAAVALVLMAVLGLLFALGLYYPLRNRSFLPVIIATIGASIMFQNGALAVFGPSPEKLRPVIEAGPTGGVMLGGVFFDYQYVVILGVTLVLVVTQYAFFEYTLLGKKMQATSQDKDMARLLGIPVTLMIALTFVYSTVLGGLAGMLVAPIYFVTHKMGAVLGLKAFAVTIAGGFGDVRGAIAGGLALGVIETFGAAYVSVVYKDAFAFLLLILFLLFRPQGIFGEKVAEKA
ncbi:MAG: branched-chain amino acid ABC transporter permease [Candidatus Rokuibacteriota bacterium]|nr:MAG: branched-chain amino acid ABC transporter permease [Candidatus Rokubacteria bacterium]PYN13669.1 MAG: branched-chain amino acid ABC transporter permease [Candidatus Rokubacteria bacterium]